MSSFRAASQRRRATNGSATNLVRIGGESFLMGSEAPEAVPEDGEGPVRQVRLDSFLLAKYPATNEQFSQFVRATGYVTEAERFGWSLVFRAQATPDMDHVAVPGMPWWVRVGGAMWSRPEGPSSSISDRLDHPVVQVSWNDAIAYCEWSGHRLPTEAEWEFGARGGLEQNRYPWGDDLLPNGRHMCNIWQGVFPDVNLAEDGYAATAPASAFSPNNFGLFTMIGNVWEWCSDYFSSDPLRTEVRSNPAGPDSGPGHVIRGGSYLCHESYCFRYRNSARTYNTSGTATCHTGFRVAMDCQ